MFKPSYTLCFSLLGGAILASSVAVAAPLPSPGPGQSPAPAATDASLYGAEGPQQGYYGYKDPKEEKKEEPEEEPETAPTPPPEAPWEPSLADYSEAQLWDMHPDEFQKLERAILKKAVRRPSEQNVVEYYTMLDFAQRKARAFANVQAYVVQKYSQFDMRNVVSNNNPGTMAITRAGMADTKAQLSAASGDYGILLVSSSTCDGCSDQRGIIERLMRRIGWSDMKEIDIESPLAQTLGATTAPTTYLVSRETGESFPIGRGIIAGSDIESALYRTTRLLSGTSTLERFATPSYQIDSGLDPRPPADRPH